MTMYAELIHELTKYSKIEELKRIQNQLKAEITCIGEEKRLMIKYLMVTLAIEKVKRKKAFFRKNNPSKKLLIPLNKKELTKS